MKVMPVAIPLQAPDMLAKETYAGKESFAGVLNKAVDKLNQAELKADEAVQKFLVGEIQDLHQVTIAMQEAKLTMQLAVEVRNKIVEAYQEISRMQL
ncbi:flagellar hook-basal body complex protein FliE [Desulforamulus hydrothermalis]|uniref:Flagellar hook-basal body complex protein FliE n=1 Tax=Desulforamulus hydrothermalis Lam5 = DSM 18033 TaxID=1121428 RepID=K8EKU5_9FIRM|nr:flagellar hook-basal body complex protein FliE [Desulforamulus hydrothermalis]CCO09161.1 MS-ring rod junction protein FliE [Desulforamulus hydrothermalis Lam5 = DSM 18033]SHH11472.1 flagellar hook-basal body complex protein FliE [Desulforamulus hydrothermalis Lam5 = DSM 18033]